MKQLLLLSVLAVAHAQFPNGRILEPPVPALCAQRVIHERFADSKYILLYICILYIILVIL